MWSGANSCGENRGGRQSALLYASQPYMTAKMLVYIMCSGSNFNSGGLYCVSDVTKQLTVLV